MADAVMVQMSCTDAAGAASVDLRVVESPGGEPHCAVPPPFDAEATSGALTPCGLPEVTATASWGDDVI